MQQVAATITISRRGAVKTIDNHFEDCVRDWPDGEYKLVLATPPTAQPAPVQDGWKLVPEDPTNAMLRAVDRVDFTNADTDGTTINVWQAMLAAAPEKGQP